MYKEKRQTLVAHAKSAISDWWYESSFERHLRCTDSSYCGVLRYCIK